MSTRFLTLDEVLAIHAQWIELFGGSLGIRDVGLLESALAMPSAGFGDEDMHPTLHEKAAAYLYHIVKNHPFLDGNKRVGAAVALGFLGINGVSIETTNDELADLVLAVATGERSKANAAVFFAAHSVPIAG
jgi:death-on-curing protein